ncbi:MAG TPA: hypothetical protein EYN68_09250 [Candidatus Marinimicrobia bacterium]|jgi:predicted membrane chloride channel (bestrophin family)|nr:hypothetical protein [Candidatus Neomarinimicrobiota bacterium]HIN61615.1 hypothetical protein [Candidatus Neomarinimicrobiota bacterium]HIO74415.1 hypothetical protein [Candidatus Neomarinimicrobiota bacterium]HIO89261.1 hypothetical protein [Candidatus Neomarinimicrobiota bacterium]
MVITLASLLFSYQYTLIYNIDLTLISIAIIFPLVFTIRGSFQRRENALEHLSLFRGALKAIYYCFMGNKKMDQTNKNIVSGILTDISDSLMAHLQGNDFETDQFDRIVNRVFEFTEEQKEFISERLRIRIYRFMEHVHESIDNLIAIDIHRTPISLKAYCEAYIYIFPLVYTPTIINKVGLDTPVVITYFIVLLSEFMLISLYNIQDQLEYPFDKEGLDDINIEIFKIDR